MGDTTVETNEKVVPLQNARVFRISGDLAPKGKTSLSFLSPIEVLGSDGELLGWASVHETKNALTALMVVCYATPERLSIETGSDRFYARIRGVATIPAEPFERTGLLELDGTETMIEVLSVELNRAPGYAGQEPLGEVVFG